MSAHLPGGDDSTLIAPAAPHVTPGPRPTFSVVIAAWNASATIGRAVGSVLEQTVPARDIVVCDDGSTDDLVSTLEPFGGAVRLLRRSHKGEAAAKNAAAAAGDGDFVVILDADDMWYPRRLARLGDLAVARPDLDLLTTDAWFEVDGRTTRTFYKERFPFPVRDQRSEILRRNFVMSHAAVRRSRWEELGGFDENVVQGADWDCWLRLLFAGGHAGCVDEPLARYRIWEGSMSGDRTASLRARVELLDRVALRVDVTPQERRVLAQSRAAHGRRALVAEAEKALLTRSPDRRLRCIRLAKARGVGARTRGRALIAGLAPELAGQRLRRRQEGGAPSSLRRSAGAG